MTTSVIVPVLNKWELTSGFLRSLEPAQYHRALVLDNGSTDATARGIRLMQRRPAYRGKLHRTSQPGKSIYQLWNHGFDWARAGAQREWYVLVSNNDVELPPGALSALRAPLLNETDAWVTYPDYDALWDAWRGHTVWRETRGVLSDGGMLGACFMLAGHRIPWRPLITDLSYEWWYGDNHLAEEIEQHGGRQIRVEGLPIKHVNEGTAQTELHPGVLYGMKYRDRHRWITRYERQA